MPDDVVEHGRARLADLNPATTVAMGKLEPMRFKLEKGLKPLAFLLGSAPVRQRQPRGGVSLNFFQHILHLRGTGCEQSACEASDGWRGGQLLVLNLDLGLNHNPVGCRTD